MSSQLTGFFNRTSTIQWCILIFLVNILFRLINITHGSYFLDETANLWHYQQDLGTVMTRSLNDPNPPVYGSLIWGWIQIFGVSELSTRLFSVICIAFCGVVLFVFSKRHLNLKIALIASSFFLFSHYLFHYSHAARPYALICLEVTVSYFFLFEYIRNKTSSWLLAYFLINIILLYTHPTQVFNLMAHGIYMLVFITKDFKLMLKVWGAIALAVLVYFIWYSISPFFDKPKETWFDTPNWKIFKFTLSRLFDGLWLPITLLIGGIISIGLYVRKKIEFNHKAKLTLLICCWVLLPIAFNYIFSEITGVSIFSGQYLITVVPGFYVLLAITIYFLAQNFFKPLAYISVIICVLMAVSINYESNFREDWRGAVDFAKENQIENTAIFVSPQYQNRSFAYYYNQSFYEDYNNTFRLLDSCHVYLERTTPIENLIQNEEYDRLIIVIASKHPKKNPNFKFAASKSTLIQQEGFGSLNVYLFNTTY